MPEWRVSRFDPSRRDADGAYPAGDWTSWADIGRTFAGAPLTLWEYLETEDRYVEAALAFFGGTGLPRLAVTGLEPVRAPSSRAVELGLADLLDEGPPLREGLRAGADGIARVVRVLLRELVWCRLEAPGKFFIHVGYDLLMYVGSRADQPVGVDAAQALGLYVERVDSPHLPRINTLS